MMMMMMVVVMMMVLVSPISSWSHVRLHKKTQTAGKLISMTSSLRQLRPGGVKPGGFRARNDKGASHSWSQTDAHLLG